MIATTTVLHEHTGTAVRDLLRQRAALPAGHPDRAALRTRCVEAGLPLARSVARRFRGTGEPMDDLYQVAALALIRVVDRFDPERVDRDRDGAFAAYAVPTIVGALKRHFRDTTWRVRVPRSVQDLAVRLGPAVAALAQEVGGTPTRRQLAARLGTTEDAVAEALDAWRSRRPESLDTGATSDGEGHRRVIDTLGGPDPRLDATADRHTLRAVLATLPTDQRRVLTMRYVDDLTQVEIATRTGLSPMGVSRLLSRSVAKLRVHVTDSPEPPRTGAGRTCAPAPQVLHCR